MGAVCSGDSPIIFWIKLELRVRRISLLNASVLDVVYDHVVYSVPCVFLELYLTAKILFLSFHIHSTFMSNKKKIFSKEVSIVLCGKAGQGIQTIEAILTMVLNSEQYSVCATKEYMSRVRGGSNSVEIRVSEMFRNAFVERIDVLFPMDGDSLKYVSNRIGPDTVIIGDKDHVHGKLEGDALIFHVPFAEASHELGNEVYINTIVAGFILSFFDVQQQTIERVLQRIFSRKGDEVVAKNIQAIHKGKQLAEQYEHEHPLDIRVQKNTNSDRDVFMNGTDAVALGAVSGGCNFIASYPMSPGTGVLTSLAGFSKKLDIVVEQAEDEISAITMGLGAWYAGARAMVTTSGGGFALMAESISLAGMIESPMVIHIGQRPGPATGLPTRTEQGDLNFVLHAGHGEFPRVILAPGTIEDGYDLARRAFDIADKYQVPVFLLTDQYFLDTLCSARSKDMVIEKVQNYFVETSKEYERYSLTEDGLTPRGIPGFGEGLVCVDSDEHDETGHITESFEVREHMMQKRMSRFALLAEGEIEPIFSGNERASTLVVSWGSTYGAVQESLEILHDSTIAHAHARQVFPVPEQLKQRVLDVERVVVVENNWSGQFADLIEKVTGKRTERIVQYNGLPFGVRNLSERIRDVLA